MEKIISNNEMEKNISGNEMGKSISSNEMDKKKVIKFVVITYLLAWTGSTIGSIIKRNSADSATGLMVFQAALALMMYTPIISVLIVNHGLKGMGWIPKFKGNIRWLIFSIVSPIILTILGYICFFAIFPDLFALDGSYLTKVYESHGQDPKVVLSSIESSGLDIRTVMIITMLECMVVVPFINMFTAIGEEAGWRGFLYPELNKGFGKVKGWLIGGLIWSGFHYPAIAIGGHDYGLKYYGAPILGIVVFTITCTAMGVLHEIIYDKTKCIWYPAIFHGAINGSFTLYNMVLNGEHYDKIEKLMILGPGYLSLISGIPMIILAVIMGVLVMRGEKVSQNSQG